MAVNLLEDQNHQSRLDNWMECQDYNYRKLAQFEKDVAEFQEKLDAAQAEIRKLGAVELEGAFDSSIYGLFLVLDQERSEAQAKIDLAERKFGIGSKGTGSPNIRRPEQHVG